MRIERPEIEVNLYLARRENEELKAKLAAVEKARDAYKSDVDILESKIIKAEKERDEWKWLFEMREAHNAVLVVALEQIADLSLSLIDDPNNDISRVIASTLKQAPSDSAERVQKLVEALDKLARLGMGDVYGNSIGNVIAQDALRAWREGSGE